MRAISKLGCLLVTLAAIGCAAPTGTSVTVQATESPVATASPIPTTPTPTPWDLMSPTAIYIPPATVVTQPPAVSPTTTVAPLPIPPSPSALPVVCDIAWFTAAAPEGACPTSAAATSSAAYQAFQNGAMIWRPGKGFIILPFDPATLTQNGIISFEPDDITAYRDTTDQFPAPPGLLAPISGFGIIWRGDHLPENTGGYGQILKWATSPEQGYTLTEQVGSQAVEMGATKTTALYTLLTLPDGRLLWLSRLAMPNQMTTMSILSAP